jgi:hypothetical protein
MIRIRLPKNADLHPPYKHVLRISFSDTLGLYLWVRYSVESAECTLQTQALRWATGKRVDTTV